jgi:prophage maintenance system killer protein
MEATKRGVANENQLMYLDFNDLSFIALSDQFHKSMVNMETKTQTKKVIIDSGRNKSCNVVQCIK